MRPETIQRRISIATVYLRALLLLLLTGVAATVASAAPTPARLTDIGTNAPAAGASDITQLGKTGNMILPDALLYFTDTETDHSAGEPGQTFKTGASPGGYLLNSLALKSSGLTATSSASVTNNYLLHIYSVARTNATLLATYITSTPLKYTPGHWLQWTGLAVPLPPGTNFAYSFGNAAVDGISGDSLGVASGNTYTNGEIALIRPATGSLSFGATHNYDATFELGFTPLTFHQLPTLTNYSPTSVQTTSATLNAQILTAGTEPLTVASLYYGTSNAGTNAAAWQHSLILAASTNKYSVPLTGLTVTTTYYYALSVSNNLGVAWAAPAASFATLTPPGIATLTNISATNIGTNAATLNAQVLTNGGSTLLSARMYYGTNNGGNNAAAWQHSITLNTSATTFAVAVTNLLTNAAHFYTLGASNAVGGAWATPRTFQTLKPRTPPAMYTYHNDNARSGLNTNETLLTLANVNTNNFGKLFSQDVDGQIYAQPLVVPNVSIPGQGLHNVVYAATEHGTIYAFDADSNTGTNNGLLWSTNLGVAIIMPNWDFDTRYAYYYNIFPETSITATPVIDPATGTLYVDVMTHDAPSVYNHRLHALDITTGQERPNSPVLVNASVPGNGIDSTNGVMSFNPVVQLARAALTLAGGKVYVSFGSFADTDTYHGWIIGYDAATLQPLADQVFNTSPNATRAAFGGHAGAAGIWMAGSGLAVDDHTNLFVVTGNGSFTAQTNGGDYGDSVIKFSTTNGLAVSDYFTPYNQAALQLADFDLGAGGSLLLPDEAGSAAHPHLLVCAGKGGSMYLVDRDNLGGYNPTNDPVVQVLPNPFQAVCSSPAYFNHRIYYQGCYDNLKVFSISNAVLSSSTLAYGQDGSGFPGCTPAISANSTSNAIVWLLQTDAYAGDGPAVLRAYNATNITKELYNSSQNFARDYPGAALKMTVPTIVNGKVYVGAEYKLSVYGNRLFIATPSISPNGGYFTNTLAVTLTDGLPGTTLYYTLDGSVPTTNSSVYTGPFTLTNSATVSAMAVDSNLISSAVVSARFLDGVIVGTGTGLLGAYYTNGSDLPFIGNPTLVRTDATVNFNWAGLPPLSILPTNPFTVRWTGCVQPQLDEPYTFYTMANQGVRLWVNGQLLIDGWSGSGTATNQRTIHLSGQQYYNFVLEYYSGILAPSVQLAWSSPSTPQQIIPATQLYPFTNPPPTVVLTSPANGASFVGTASVTLTADADAPYNSVTKVDFYVNNALQATITDPPYSLTLSGLTNNNYIIQGVATDGSGVSGLAPAVKISVTNGSGRPYGLSARTVTPPFWNMPATFDGAIPPLLSQTGVFTNAASMAPADGLIPYQPNVPLWSDNAIKTRYMAVPFNGGYSTPDEQITYSPTGSWTFPAGTVFVKTFELQTNDVDTNSLQRLETRLLVRDINGRAYGVTYKWRADNSDADLLTAALSQDIPIITATGMRTQNWYYPSPADCLACHTPVANYVLGVNARQLNHRQTYTGTGITDNQLRTLNQLGIFNPAFDASTISGVARLSALTNLNASLDDRARSYLDVNCAQCHQPAGTGPSFDARFETPLASQNITNNPARFSLGYDRACIVKPRDVWRSTLYDRMNIADATVSTHIQMPPLGRNLIDTNAVSVIADWINSLPGTPTFAPPALTPNGGTFDPSVDVSLESPDTNALIYYTLDGSLPTTNSLLYSGPFTVYDTETITASAFGDGFDNSVAASAYFSLPPPMHFIGTTLFNGSFFQLRFSGIAGNTYVLQATTNFIDWINLTTNQPTSDLFNFFDFDAANHPYRFYRVLQQ